MASAWRLKLILLLTSRYAVRCAQYNNYGVVQFECIFIFCAVCHYVAQCAKRTLHMVSLQCIAFSSSSSSSMAGSENLKYAILFRI